MRYKSGKIGEDFMTKNKYYYFPLFLNLRGLFIALLCGVSGRGMGDKISKAICFLTATGNLKFLGLNPNRT
jgi:hypothetical protein